MDLVQFYIWEGNQKLKKIVKQKKCFFHKLFFFNPVVLFAQFYLNMKAKRSCD